MLLLLLDLMTVRRLRGTSTVYQGVKGAPGVSNCPRGSRWMSGVSKVGVQLSQGVKRGVRGVPGVKGSLGDPKGLGGASEVY